MASEAPTTSTNDAPSSEEATNSGTPAPASPSSTTDQPTDETVDLAAPVEGDPAPSGDDTQAGGEGDDTQAGDKGGDEANPLFGAPAEDAAYELSGLPEGVTVDGEALEALTPLARELNLSNEGVSRLAGLYAEKILPRVAEQTLANIEQNVVQQRQTWEQEALAAVRGKDAKGEEVELKNAAGEKLDFDGKDLKSVRGIAAKALDRLAPTGFRQFLQETGLSVHPAMMAFAYQAGKAIKEDTDFEQGGGEPPRAKTREAKFYNR